MAPYMMSVGLFVACMAFTLMYPLMEKNEEVKSGLQWWLSKVTVMAAVSIAQAVIMVAVLMGINGLEPHYVGKTFGMAVLASMAFMSLICFGRDVIKPCRKFRHVSIHGRTVRCSRRNLSTGYGPTLLHSITQIYAIQLYSTRIPSHTIYGWTDRTGYCSICWNLSCVNISNDHLLPLQNEETGWRNIGT